MSGDKARFEAEWLRRQAEALERQTRAEEFEFDPLKFPRYELQDASLPILPMTTAERSAIDAAIAYTKAASELGDSMDSVLLSKAIHKQAEMFAAVDRLVEERKGQHHER